MYLQASSKICGIYLFVPTQTDECARLNPLFYKAIVTAAQVYNHTPSRASGRNRTDTDYSNWQIYREIVHTWSWLN